MSGAFAACGGAAAPARDLARPNALVLRHLFVSAPPASAARRRALAAPPAARRRKAADAEEEEERAARAQRLLDEAAARFPPGFEGYTESMARGLEPLPSAPAAPAAVDGGAAAAAAAAAAALARLPGARRHVAPEGAGASEDLDARRGGFFGGRTLPLGADPGPLGDWDLRAGMEARRRRERERAAWLARRAAALRRAPTGGADWRSDRRVRDTGDPTAPAYREWSLAEIWDLVLLGGAATDPREVPRRVTAPGARTDFIAEGYRVKAPIHEWLAAQGRLIEEGDEAAVADADAEAALLASEFSDFDDWASKGEAGAGAGGAEEGGAEGW
jgi:hypothetical protein